MLIYLPATLTTAWQKDHADLFDRLSRTYSSGTCHPGFRYLQDSAVIKGMYRDPDITWQSHPGYIGSAMVDQAGAALDKIKWNRTDVEHFIGTYLTEPKPHIFFMPPSDPLAEKKFVCEIKENGLQLDLKSRMLYRKKTIFLNGDAYAAGATARRSLVKLADRLILPTAKHFNDEALALCYQWYL